MNSKKKLDKSVISITNKRKISLKKRFKKYNGKNQSKKFSWDDARGKEIW